MGVMSDYCMRCGIPHDGKCLRDENRVGDSLRDRIAAVLFSLNAGEDWNMEPLVWEEISDSYRECWFKQADAVIRELGLEPQMHYDPDCEFYRYVTDWIAPND